MRHALALAILIGLAPIRPADALIPQDPRERAVVFATCLGRYMAVTDAAAFYGQDRDSARNRQEVFRMLLDAVTPDAAATGTPRRDLLRHRMGARQTQQRLTWLAQREEDARRATTAATMARRAVRMCDALV